MRGDLGRATGGARPSWRRQVSVRWAPGNRVATWACHIKGWGGPVCGARPYGRKCAGVRGCSRPMGAPGPVREAYKRDRGLTSTGCECRGGPDLWLPRAASGQPHARHRPRRAARCGRRRRRLGLARPVARDRPRRAARRGQLAAVSVLIGWVVRSLPPLLCFVALMYAVAVRTAGRRITRNRTWWWAAVPIAAGSRRWSPCCCSPGSCRSGASR